MAVVDYMESPVSKKIVRKTDTVAKIVNKFGGGIKHTSEGQKGKKGKGGVAGVQLICARAITMNP